ncbi:MAG TPA: hypothetical protein VFJ04_00710 [Rhodanobacteraceae bacterium]|jgi:hypothetical protein|nr:hypothetical protein [Rhodanobacteraceae bacterium]
MRFRYLLLSSLAALTACSAPPPPSADTPVIAATVPAVPANPVLGSQAWYAWVDRALGIDAAKLQPGSAPWNREVQERLGQEAPQSKPGSPEWQQAVDALLRTRTLAAP